MGAALVCPAESSRPDREAADFFEKKVRPMLAARCHTCHSAAANKSSGGLRLDSRQALLKGGDSGPAVVPGDPDRSLLIRAIRRSDGKRQMPPREMLKAEEVADLSDRQANLRNEYSEDVLRARTLHEQVQSQYNEALYLHALALAGLERVTAGGFCPPFRVPPPQP